MKYLRNILLTALRPAFKTTLWLLKIMLPVTFGVAILNYFGIIEKFSVVASPLFSLMGLEGKAAIPFVTSIFTNLYAAIGVMASLSLDYRTVTILTTMCLISHNMIVECKIQQKSGSPVIYIVLLRIISSLLSGIILNFVLPADYNGTLVMSVAPQNYNSLVEVFWGWARSSLALTGQIIVIVYSLNVIQNILKAYNLIEKLKKPLTPIMKMLGLPASTSILWTIANTLGLAYGGMAIVEELKKGDVSLEDVRLMNTSIALTHSLLEDSMVFVAIGVGLPLVVIPRLLFSIVAVWGHKHLRRRFKLSYL